MTFLAAETITLVILLGTQADLREHSGTSLGKPDERV